MGLLMMTSLVAAADDRTALGPPPLRLIETLSPQGVQDVAPGAVISRAVIGRPDSALIGDRDRTRLEGREKALRARRLSSAPPA